MICIVGAGLAGDTLAGTLRLAGYHGALTLIGEELEPPYDRPPLSKEWITADSPSERVFLRSRSWYDSNNVELSLGGSVVALDTKACRISLRDGESILYDKLVIATGTRARTLAGQEHAAVPVLTLRTIADARRLRSLLEPGRRVVVIGAGVVGLEVAASAIKRGCSVNVIEISDRVLNRVAPKQVSDRMTALHLANGVSVHLSAGDVSFGERGVRTTRLGYFPADVVVVSIGVIPNDEWARDAGLNCEDGIVVDAFGETSQPNVFAVGDVARFPCPIQGRYVRREDWAHARKHPEIVAKNLLGMSSPYVEVPSMWSDQFDVKLQTVGVLHSDLPIIRGDTSNKKFSLFYCDAEGRLIGAAGINQPREMRLAMKLIEASVRVDPDQLADTTHDLAKIGR